MGCTRTRHSSILANAQYTHIPLHHQTQTDSRTNSARLFLKYLHRHRLQSLVILSNAARVKMFISLASR